MPNLYKMQNDAVPGRLGGPPFIFGSALRVPSTAYSNWNISGSNRALFPLSLTTYQDEFAETSPAWMESVVEAAKRGDIGDRPNMLRKAVGEKAAELTYDKLRRQDIVRVLDVGCGSGGSLAAYLDALQSIRPSYLRRVELTGVDLSRQNLWKTADLMRDRGFDLGSNLFLAHSRDIDMATQVPQISQDIVINVAGIHANAYLEPSFRAIASVLGNGGYFVSGDWHHGRWLHPSWTYRLLEEMDEQQYEWTNKGAVLDEFRGMFPLATQEPDLSWATDADLVAIDEIARYWRDGWAPVRLEKIREGRLLAGDEQIVAEGHRPHEEYIKEGYRHGMPIVDQKQVVPGTNLNMLLVMKISE